MSFRKDHLPLPPKLGSELMASQYLISAARAVSYCTSKHALHIHKKVNVDLLLRLHFAVFNYSAVIMTEKLLKLLSFCRLSQIFDQHSWADDLHNVISRVWDSLSQGVNTRYTGDVQTGDRSGCQGSCCILAPVWVCNWEQMCPILSFFAVSADSSFLVPILPTKLEFVLPRSTHGC